MDACVCTHTIHRHNNLYFLSFFLFLISSIAYVHLHVEESYKEPSRIYWKRGRPEGTRPSIQCQSFWLCRWITSSSLRWFCRCLRSSAPVDSGRRLLWFLSCSPRWRCCWCWPWSPCCCWGWRSERLWSVCRHVPALPVEAGANDIRSDQISISIYVSIINNSHKIPLNKNKLVWLYTYLLYVLF